MCKNTDCTCCELDNLFSEIYSGETVPYGPISFLATTWRASSELAGYAQQDAHEFFINALNQIHATSRGSTNVSCNCIIHTTFLGQLQSEVKCERCGTVTSTVDPMLDISLEVEGDKDSDATLGSCLRRFTKPETLGSKEYSCSKCKQTPHVSLVFSLSRPSMLNRTHRITASNQTAKHSGASACSECSIQGKYRVELVPSPKGDTLLHYRDSSIERPIRLPRRRSTRGSGFPPRSIWRLIPHSL